MEWVIVFIINWILFVLLVDWKKLKVNFWCGIFAMLLQYAVDSQAINHGLYKINKAVIQFGGSSIFFIIGPVFVIGILFAQYHPFIWWMRVLNILVITILYSMEEYLLLKRGVLEYTNWYTIDSIIVNLSAMIILSWFTMIVLHKERKT